MASQTTNYQCPSCTGPLHYDGATGKLVCDYCGSSFTVQEVEAMFEKKNEQAEQAFAEAASQSIEPGSWDESAMQNWGKEADGLKAYNCTSCGAELICDNNTAATECPYCGNPTIIPGQFSGDLKPEYVIPFKLDKKDALAALRKHYGGKKLLPRVFADENHIQKVQGVYVPFWLYNGTADVDAQFKGEQIFTHRQGNDKVTETNIFQLNRSGTVEFSNIPVDASEKMDDALMDSIEPYDYSELKPFSMSYLPGYLADKYDVTAEQCAQRADERAANTAVAEMRKTTSAYVSVHETGRSVHLNRGKVHYALMPVWLLNTKWEDKNYVFAMNGQTGKLVGDLPMDKGLAKKTHLIYAGIAAAALFAFQCILTFL